MYMMADFCPMCLSEVTLYQINEDNGIEICSNINCIYPFISDGQLKLVNRSFKLLKASKDLTRLQNKSIPTPTAEEDFYIQELENLLNSIEPDN